MTKKNNTNNEAKCVQLLEAAIKARIPAMMVGNPGIGKTAHVRLLAEKMGYELITLVASRMDPTEINGLVSPGTYRVPRVIDPSKYADEMFSAGWKLAGDHRQQILKAVSEDALIDIDDEAIAECAIEGELKETSIESLKVKFYQDDAEARNEATTTEAKNIPVAQYNLPDWAIEAIEKKKVVLFFDEFSNSAPAVQAALLSFIQDREVGTGHKIPDETIILGAMNPSENAVDGYEIASAMANRLLFIPWETPKETWLLGMANAWGNKVSKEEKEWRSMIVRFIRKQPGFIEILPDEGEVLRNPELYGFSENDFSRKDIARYAWASGRSWDTLSKLLPNLDTKDSEMVLMAAQGVVGVVAAREFAKFVKESSSTISAEEALDNPSGVEWGAMELGEKKALIENCLYLTEKSPKRVEDYIDLAVSAYESDEASVFAPYLSTDKIEGIIKRFCGRNPKKYKTLKEKFYSEVYVPYFDGNTLMKDQ